jgi:hypothetical protein
MQRSTRKAAQVTAVSRLPESFTAAMEVRCQVRRANLPAATTPSLFSDLPAEPCHRRCILVRHKKQPTGSHREINLLRGIPASQTIYRAGKVLKIRQPVGGKIGRLLASGQMFMARFIRKDAWSLIADISCSECVAFAVRKIFRNFSKKIAIHLCLRSQ